jgi:hypothetical protein
MTWGLVPSGSARRCPRETEVRFNASSGSANISCPCAPSERICSRWSWSCKSTCLLCAWRRTWSQRNWHCSRRSGLLSQARPRRPPFDRKPPAGVGTLNRRVVVAVRPKRRGHARQRRELFIFAGSVSVKTREGRRAGAQQQATATCFERGAGSGSRPPAKNGRGACRAHAALPRVRADTNRLRTSSERAPAAIFFPSSSAAYRTSTARLPSVLIFATPMMMPIS